MQKTEKSKEVSVMKGRGQESSTCTSSFMCIFVFRKDADPYQLPLVPHKIEAPPSMQSKRLFLVI